MLLASDILDRLVHICLAGQKVQLQVLKLLQQCVITISIRSVALVVVVVVVLRFCTYASILTKWHLRLCPNLKL